MQTQSGLSTTAADIEVHLRRALGLPATRVAPLAGGSTSATRSKAFTHHPDFDRLRQALVELRHRTAAVGTLPQGYPRHVDFVIRGISALLPWYTRTIRHQAESAERVSFALFDAITLVGQRVDELAAQTNALQEMNSQSSFRSNENSRPD